MVTNNQQQEKSQDFKDFELVKLLFQEVTSADSDPVDLLDKSFEARFQSLVDQIQSYLHSSEKVGFFPHRFLGWFSSVLDTKLNDKLGIKKLHFRFEGARTLKVVAETESKTRVFIFTEDIEAQYSKSSQARTKNFEFTKGEWKDVMGRDYTQSDEGKLQIDVIKILKDKYELVKSKPKSDKDVKSKKLHLYLKNNVLEYKAKNVYGNTQTIQISRDELKGNYAFKNLFFNEIKQFLDGSNKGLSDNVRIELSRITSAKGYTLKSDGEGEKINIKVERNKKIKGESIAPPAEFPFTEIKKKLGKSVYLEDYIEKLANPGAEIDQIRKNLEDILNYIKKVHTDLNLQDNVYGIRAREADQHGFVAGIFDNFRYRDNTKLYLEQFAGGGYADIVLLVRGPNRAVYSVPILVELKAGSKGQVTPNDALRQAEDYIKGFRPNKMRILTNAGDAIAVGLNLDNAEPFKTEVKPIKQPPSPSMEKILTDICDWDGSQHTRAQLEEQIKSALSSEYHTFPANKETKDHYYFSRNILGQSILINKVGQDQSNIKKYIYSYDEYPLNWPQGTEYTLSKSPVMTLIFVQGNEGQEKTAFIFHIRESNTKEFYADKKIPVLNIPEIGGVGNVIEIKMSLKKYETGLSFEDLFEIEQISKYKPSGADQPFTGNFLKIPNSDELKVKFDQAITSQHATSSDGKDLLPDYKRLLNEIADAIYPIKDLITNEARLQAILNGLFSSYSDLKLQETSAKTVIIPEFQVGAGGRVDMVIQGIGPSPQGTKEYTPIALEFKLIDKNLNQDQLKQEVDKLTKEQNIRYAKGAALKTITDNDKMFFMGVVVNVRAKDKDSLILTSDELVPAIVVHSSIDIAKRKHLEGIQEITQRLKNIGIQEENLRTLESATAEKDYHYWLQQHDIADIARIEYGYGADTLFEIVGSPEHIVNQLQQFQDSVTTRGERRPLTLIVNLDNNHWVTLVVAYQNGQYNGYYVDSLGNSIPDNIYQILQHDQITIHDVSVAQQGDDYNCGLWALENARDINAVLRGSNTPDEIRNRLQIRGRDEDYFIRTRGDVSEALSIDPQRIANLEAVLAETEAPRKKFNLNSCVGQSSRRKRSTNPCLFSKGDVEKFSKGNIDENNVDKIIIDSEKFLTYVKNSQDEGKNAQLIEFVGDKNIEGNHKYLFDKVVEDQGYERYIQNERIKDLHGDISQKTSSAIKSSKLKGRLINAAGGIQLIRGIHGAIVSCEKGTATDCGLNLGGIAWSFASQPIENVMVKITPKVVASAERVVGKVIPGTLGKQTKFAIRIAGVKFGGAIARGTAGAITGVFDIVDISMSASNLVDCKKREGSDNPCGEKEIRDNIASISFSSVSFISGVALTAASMPGVGIAVGFGLMVGYGIYSGVSNIVEYEKKYDTTHEENWSIFWRTLLFQGMAPDVQHLATRKDAVNSLAKEVWKALNNGPNSVVAYGVGLGEGNPLRPCSAKIVMSSQDADTRSISRVIPDSIENAKMIGLPHITNADYEKGLRKSVPTAVHYCDNAMVIADGRKSMQSGKTIVYDLRNVNSGSIIGSNKLDNSFIIFEGSEKIIGGDNTVNRFVVTNSGFAGQIIVGTNSTNVFDFSQIADSVVKVNIEHSVGSTFSKTLHSGILKIKMNGRSLVNECVTNDVNILGYHYIGRQNKIDEISCTSSTKNFIDYDIIIDSKGGYSKDKRDIIENCSRAIILPYTNVKGVGGNYTFYVRSAEYTGKNLHSEIDVNGTGTVIFPETDLLNDCDEITYSLNDNILSLKVGLGQNNQYTLDIKNYIKQGSNQPNFMLIDKNGSNIIPKIEKLESSITKINSFELHTEHSLESFDAAENHYKKILSNNKGYKVFGVIREKLQSNSAFQHMVFGSSGGDIINFDQRNVFARGGNGSDMYVIDSNIEKREIIIDNNSDDKKLDMLVMPEVPEEFSIQQCNLHLSYNNTRVQVRNYLQGNSYRHLMVMNSKGETFIPYVQSMSCVGSPIENGKLVPFFHTTQTQNMFLLPKDFEGDHVVIDSNLEDIEKYKDEDDLLLTGEGEIPFIIRIEDFYNDQSKWRDVNFLLWNDGNFSPYLGLRQEIDKVMDYRNKLKSDYEKTVKEYVIDFTQSVSITHNQNNTLTSVREDEERIGIVILKNITPDRIKVSNSDTDLVFSDKVSNHTINIKNWNNSESYRISTLEFDLGLEPIIIRKLDRFSLSKVEKIQDLIEKASDNYQKRAKYAPSIESDFKCLVSVNGFKNESKTYECLGFSSLQDQINFTENVCSVEQIEDFRGKISNNDQVLLSLKKLQNDLSLNGYDQNIIDQCNKLMITSELEILKLLINNAAQKGEWERVKDLLDATANRSNADIANKNKWSSNWTLLHYAVYNGNSDLFRDIFELLLSRVTDANAKDKYGWTPLHYAAYYNEPEMVNFLIGKGVNIDIRDINGKTPLEVADKYGKLEILNILMSKFIKNNQFNVVKNFLKETAKEVKIEDKNEWKASWKLLHYAAYNGKVDVLRGLFDLLLEKSGGNINVRESKYNWTPLHYAVYYGRSEMVELFIEKGADIEAKTMYGATPLHIAARYCGLDMAVLLVRRGCNIKAKNNQKQVPLEVTKNQEVRRFLKSPLHYAAREGDMDLLQAVLKVDDNYTPLRFNVTDPKSGTVSSALIPYDTDNQTPLHYAVQYNRFDLIKVFTLGGSEYITFAIGRLSLIGLIDAKDGDGRTPLHIAAQQGCMASITLLLDGGATIEAVDSSSRTPLHIAAYYHKFDAVKYLISRGANTNAKDKVGKSPHYYLISEYRAYDKKRRSTSDSVQQSCTIQSQAERLDVFELLIGKANIEDRDDDGQTPFHVAAQKGKLGVARLLVKKIESVNFEDSLHEEPDELVRAVRQRERLKFLINQKDKFDYTPLQYAAKNGNWGMVNLFLDKTAERNQDDVAGKDEFSTSWTTVHYAVYNGNMDLLNYIFPLLSDKNTVMNMKDSSGWTPLHYAVHYNALNMVKFLVNEGANVNAKDNGGNTLLHYAAGGGDLDMVKFLIKNGADINVKNSRNLIPLQVVGSNSNVERVLRQAHLDKELLLTVKNEKDLKTIDDLIAKDIDDRTRGVFYYTWSGNLGKVELLVSKDVSVNATDKYGCTLLHWSALKGHSDIAKFLVDKGANVNAKDILGRTPMHFAAMNNHNDIQDACDRGPMYTAAESNDEEFIQLFLMKGASINEADKNGETPLHWASWSGNLGVVEYLIGKGANISAKDKDGRTPLDVAKDKRYDNVAEFLKQTQLQLNEQLLTAVQGGDFKKVKDLVNRGASLEDANIDAQDKEGKTPLHFAAQEGDFGMVQFFLDRGAKIEAKDKYGWTPLHFAASSNKFDVVKFLFDKNANIKARDTYGDTPLHVAAQYSNKLEIVEFLLDKNANDINDVTNDRSTLLHVAVEGNKLDTVKFLLDRGADIEVKDIHGQTPLVLATQKGYTNIVKVLEQEQLGKELFTAVREYNLPRVKELISQGANIDTKNKNGATLLDIAINTKDSLEKDQESPGSALLLTTQSNIVRVLEQEQLRRKLLTTVREGNLHEEKPAQRKRRHLPSESLDSVASSGTRSFSWINSCISWAKSLAASTFSIIPGLPSQYNIADKNNVKSDNKNIPQSTSSVGWNKFLNNENIALASCVADALDNTPSRRYQGLMSKGVEVVPSSRVAVEFALKKFNSFVEDKIRNLESKEQARIHVELKDAYPEIIASLERGVEFSGNVGLDNVLEKSKKRFCANVLQKDKVSTCLSGVGVTKLENNLSR